jgi:uncharacterized protein YegP (UPF0339 family)
VRIARVEFYRSRNGWRWRFRAKNGRVLANCGQGYSRLRDAEKGFEDVGGSCQFHYPKETRNR